MKLKILAFSALALTEISLKSRLIPQINTSNIYLSTADKAFKSKAYTYGLSSLKSVLAMKSAMFYLLMEIKF